MPKSESSEAVLRVGSNLPSNRDSDHRDELRPSRATDSRQTRPGHEPRSRRKPAGSPDAGRGGGAPPDSPRAAVAGAHLGLAPHWQMRPYQWNDQIRAQSERSNTGAIGTIKCRRIPDSRRARPQMCPYQCCEMWSQRVELVNWNDQIRPSRGHIPDSRRARPAGGPSGSPPSGAVRVRIDPGVACRLGIRPVRCLKSPEVPGPRVFGAAKSFRAPKNSQTFGAPNGTESRACTSQSSRPRRRRIRPTAAIRVSGAPSPDSDDPDASDSSLRVAAVGPARARAPPHRPRLPASPTRDLTILMQAIP